ncbi:hypothetical protein ABK040_010604 [Willaertia magna]
MNLKLLILINIYIHLLLPLNSSKQQQQLLSSSPTIINNKCYPNNNNTFHNNNNLCIRNFHSKINFSSSQTNKILKKMSEIKEEHFTTTTASTTLSPPIADQRKDAYFWLKDKSNQKVIDYLNKENEYCNEKTKHLESLQNQLFEEIKNRIKQTDETVPYRINNYYYYSKTEEGKQLRIYCRKKIKNNLENIIITNIDNDIYLEKEEEILLDLNKLQEELKVDFLTLGIFKICPKTENLLVYSIDTNGSEFYDVYFYNLKESKFLNLKINKDQHVGCNFEFLNENIYFTQYDTTHRPYRIYKYKIPNLNDLVINRNDCNELIIKDNEFVKLIYEDLDERFFVSIYKSLSQEYLFIDSSSKITSELYFLKIKDLNNNLDHFKLIKKREQGLEYYVCQKDEYFYIWHNLNEFINFKLIKVPIIDIINNNENIFLKKEYEYIPYTDNFYIENVIAFKNHLTIFGRSEGVPQLIIIPSPSSSLPNKEENELNKELNNRYQVTFPEPSYELYPIHNREFNSNKIRFIYSSFITPETTFDYDMNKKEFIKLKQDEVLGNYNQLNYKMKKIFAKSRDGHTDIPISLVYKINNLTNIDNLTNKDNDLDLNGNHPLLLYGYGSYGATIDAYFSHSIISLLDRGFIYAIASIRGGAENGRKWYNDGKLLQKKNTFYDFIDSAKYLIKEKYTNKNKLAIYGGSAGGLLIGACLNFNPNLFKSAILQVPFVDCVNTMLDANLPLTVTEYEEWGNPNEKHVYDYMMSYSPYDMIDNIHLDNSTNMDSTTNLEKKTFPSILIDQSLNDTRVGFWEGTKYCAKLRYHLLKNKLLDKEPFILCKTNMGAGHGGKSGRYERYKEIAFRYAFLIDQLTNN